MYLWERQKLTNYQQSYPHTMSGFFWEAPAFRLISSSAGCQLCPTDQNTQNRVLLRIFCFLSPNLERKSTILLQKQPLIEVTGVPNQFCPKTSEQKLERFSFPTWSKGLFIPSHVSIFWIIMKKTHGSHVHRCQKWWFQPPTTNTWIWHKDGPSRLIPGDFRTIVFTSDWKGRWKTPPCRASGKSCANGDIFVHPVLRIRNTSFPWIPTTPEFSLQKVSRIPPQKKEPPVFGWLQLNPLFTTFNII